jgi:hypothetical protein
MRHLHLIIYTGLLAILVAPAFAEEEPAESKLITPDDLVWIDNPLRPAARMAVIEGDPKKPGPLILRFRFPADFSVPPHWHPTGERFTILSGSMLEGIGEDGDMSKAGLLTAGSVGIFRAKTPHYVLTKEPIVVQVHTVGPLQTNPIRQ